MSIAWIIPFLFPAPLGLQVSAEPVQELLWRDFDGDQRADLLTVTAGRLQLLRDAGPQGFVDATVEFGLSEYSAVHSFALADFDADTRLDLLIVHSGSSSLLRNDGFGFSDVSQAHGLDAITGVLEARWLDGPSGTLPELLLHTEDGLLLLRRAELGFEAIALDLAAKPSQAASNLRSADNDTTLETTTLRESHTRGSRTTVDRKAPVSVSLAGIEGQLEAGVAAPTTENPDLIALSCVTSLRDQAGAGCITASSAPGVLGRLLPQTSNLFVASNGSVGVGTTSPQFGFEVNRPSSFRNDINLSDDMSTIRFPNALGLTSPMIEMFAGSQTNVDRMVLAHSAALPTRGLEFEDNTDTFKFQSSATGTPILEVSVQNNEVTVGERLTFELEGGGALATYRSANNTSTIQVDGSSTNGGGAIGIRDASGVAGLLLRGDVGNGDGLIEATGRLNVESTSNVHPKARIISSAPSTTSPTLDVVRDPNVSGSDMIQILAGAAGSATSQFIEAQRGSDIEFRVDGDGDVFADGSYTGPADFAEMIRVSTGAESIEPGDVVVIDSTSSLSVRRSTNARSTRVAGIYSTRPGFVGSERTWEVPAPEGGEAVALKRADMAELYDEIPVAVVGIVPCKASAENGPIAIGDLLVTSDTPGHVMRDPNAPNGTIVGKALEPLQGSTGTIKVLVTLQ